MRNLTGPHVLWAGHGSFNKLSIEDHGGQSSHSLFSGAEGPGEEQPRLWFRVGSNGHLG
jgi:hypothetical protein